MKKSNCWSASAIKHLKLFGLLLVPLMFIAAGCGRSPVKAREQLAKLNMDYSASYFLKSAEEGDIHALEVFLDAGMDVDVRDDQTGLTALIGASAHGQEEAVRFLLDNGADINSRCKGGTALVVAAAFNQPNVMKLLLKQKADPDVQSDMGASALILAASNGNLECVKMLLKADANLELKTLKGWTALDCARKGLYSEVLTLLREAGAVFITDDWFKGMPASRRQDIAIDVVQEARKAAKDGMTPQTFLVIREAFSKATVAGMKDTGYSPLQIVRLVQAVLGGISDARKSAFMFTVGEPSPEQTLVAKELLEIESNACDAFEAACRDYLKLPSADPDFEDEKGVTPLMLAGKFGSDVFAKWLVEKGADVMGKDQAGNTVQDYARAGGDVKIIDLVKTPARIN